MLAFSIAGRGDLLAVEIDAPSTEIKAYATRPKEGALVLTLINKGEVASVLHLDTGSPSREASVIRLTGPAIDAKKDIMLGGTEVTSRGTWKASTAEVLPVRQGQLMLPMPAASAAIVSILQSNS
jgi:hypothetical protein